MEHNKFPQFIEKANPILSTWDIIRVEKKEQLTQHQAKILKGYAIASIVTIAVTMGFGLLNFSIFGSIGWVLALTGGLWAVLTIWAAVVFAKTSYEKDVDYQKQVMANLLPSIISIYFENASFNNYYSMNAKDVQAINFFGKSNKELKIKSSFNGTYRGYPISICKIKKDRRNEHPLIHEKYLTYITIDIPLELKTPVVLNHSEYNPYLGKTINKWINKATSFITNLPTRQDYDYFIDLHKYFAVHTSDRTTGAILLQDPNYIELIELAQTALFPMRIVFMKNKISILIEDNTKELFPTPRLYNDVDEGGFMKNMYNRLDLFNLVLLTVVGIAENSTELNNQTNLPPTT